MGSLRVGHDWVTELNWAELKEKSLLYPIVPQHTFPLLLITLYEDEKSLLSSGLWLPLWPHHLPLSLQALFWSLLPSCCFSNMPGPFPLQGLGIGCSLCLGTLFYQVVTWFSLFFPLGLHSNITFLGRHSLILQSYGAQILVILATSLLAFLHSASAIWNFSGLLILLFPICLPFIGGKLPKARDFVLVTSVSTVPGIQ